MSAGAPISRAGSVPSFQRPESNKNSNSLSNDEGRATNKNFESRNHPGTSFLKGLAQVSDTFLDQILPLYTRAVSAGAGPNDSDYGKPA